MDKQEMEFKCLLRMQSFYWNTTIQISDAIENALREHPEWEKHLEYAEVSKCLRREW